MNPTWRSDDLPVTRAPGPLGWIRVLLRGLPVAIVVFGGLLILLLLRLIERPLYGLHRPITPHITQIVCRMVLRLLGMNCKIHGTPMRQKGGLVANHSAWLDIFTLNAADRIYFVSKAEVARWPAIGWLARATGTVFIRRDRREARTQNRLLEERLKAGHRLLFFPEGTSSDGQRVLPFKPTLFQAFFADDLRDRLSVQPVSVIYHAPANTDLRFYGWWGDMDFGSHLLKVLAARRNGSVDIVFHPPLRVSDFPDRKALAARCEQMVRAGFEKYHGTDPGI